MTKTIEVTFTVDLPDTNEEPTTRQIREWVKYSLHDIGGCSMTNPLVEYELEGRNICID